MVDKSILVDYVALIIQLLGRVMQLQIKREDVERGNRAFKSVEI